VLLGVTLALAGGAARVGAQMEMGPGHTEGSARPLGVPEQRAGSGTSWLPDATPMHAIHLAWGSWTLMTHGAVFLQFDDQGGPRGGSQLGVVNWGMLAASRGALGGRLHLRLMLSAEPFTIGARGYPLLLQTGEEYGGAPLVDRQHPHDLFMELAALYERRIADNLAASIYLAPVGEPALGPPAFPHRPSASSDPLAPLSHHWQDATHITFGVITAGLFTRSVKIEGSVFNGREPDENRTDFDYAGRRLDSYTGRVTVNPTPSWSLSAWYAFLNTPEQLPPAESEHRLGAAALVTRSFAPRGTWSAAVIYAANVQVGTGRSASSLVIEGSAELNRNTVFGRAEYVQKSALDLAIPPPPTPFRDVRFDLARRPPRPELHLGFPDASGVPPALYGISELTLGYLREVRGLGPLRAGVGVRGSLALLPRGLEAAYGSRTPVGASVYLRLRPAVTASRGMDQMSGDDHP